MRKRTPVILWESVPLADRAATGDHYWDPAPPGKTRCAAATTGYHGARLARCSHAARSGSDLCGIHHEQRLEHEIQMFPIEHRVGSEIVGLIRNLWSE